MQEPRWFGLRNRCNPVRPFQSQKGFDTLVRRRTMWACAGRVLSCHKDSLVARRSSSLQRRINFLPPSSGQVVEQRRSTRRRTARSRAGWFQKPICKGRAIKDKEDPQGWNHCRASGRKEGSQNTWKGRRNRDGEKGRLAEEVEGFESCGALGRPRMVGLQTSQKVLHLQTR